MSSHALAHAAPSFVGCNTSAEVKRCVTVIPQTSHFSPSLSDITKDTWLQLAIDLRNGKSESFHSIIELTSFSIQRLAYALLNDEAAAADVVQETYIRIWQSHETLKDDHSLLPWIYAIARNLAKDHRKSFWERWRHPLSDLPQEPESHASTPEHCLLNAERQQVIHRALQKLSEKNRVVLILRDIEGESEADIALSLGLPLGTVTARLHRARLRFAQLVGSMLREDL